MIYFLLLTALTVSIDSFFCGFSLAFLGGKKRFIVLGITVTVFLMSLFTNYTATLLSDSLSEKTASLGGIILIFVGIYNLVKKDSLKIDGSKSIIKQSFITGFAVGLDGALANLSLAIMGINAFYVPLTIALMHGVMITFGILLAKTKLVAKINKFGFLPPLVLILLGVYKLVGFFI